MFQKIKEKILAYLNKMSSANQEAFGNRRLSCCSHDKPGCGPSVTKRSTKPCRKAV